MQLTSPHAPNKAQHKKKKDLTKLLSAATCSLLASTTAIASSDNGSSEKSVVLGYKWSTQAAVLSYSEDGRINVNQGLLKLKGKSDKGSLQIKMGYDVVSGPSENGAAPSPNAQTFTSPSGAEDYQVNANDLPWYEIIRHPRKDISIDKSSILNKAYTFNIGARYSTEATYDSRSINMGLVRNANKKNTQFTLSASYEDAGVTPYGGVVTPRSTVLNRSQFNSEEAFISAWQDQRANGASTTGLVGGVSNEDNTTESKTVWGLVSGVTQVVNKDTLVQFNYSYGESNGYQNDAQKMVSIIDTDGLVTSNIYESRPDHRAKQSLFGKIKYSTSKSTTLDVNYRFYWDDWGISSHTIAAGYQIEVSKRFKIEPQFRVYMQSDADFFRHSVFEEDSSLNDLPAYLSADYRLAATTNYTFGINFDYHMKNKHVISARLATYSINPEENSQYKRGYLNTVDVLPSINSTVVALSYEF